MLTCTCPVSVEPSSTSSADDVGKCRTSAEGEEGEGPERRHTIQQ